MGVERILFPIHNFSRDFHVPFTTSNQFKDNIKMNYMELHVASGWIPVSHLGMNAAGELMILKINPPMVAASVY